MGDESILVNEGDELMVHYLEYTEKSVRELYGLVERLKNDDAPDTSSEALPEALNEEMHAIAHNIKGMGSSFGFPLMTQVGSNLCSYLRPLGDKKAGIDILEAHLKAMDTILNNRILGNGGGCGRYADLASGRDDFRLIPPFATLKP